MGEVIEVKVLADEPALRDLLDTLNNDGIDYKLAGMDSKNESFLACLSGVYAENLVIVFGNPWDSEVEYRTGVFCEHCQGQNLATADRLAFPISVFLPV